ncbi:hypothetical protein LINPERHAP1_LOCUS14604 [Linum perenne]
MVADGRCSQYYIWGENYKLVKKFIVTSDEAVKIELVHSSVLAGIAGPEDFVKKLFRMKRTSRFPACAKEE